MSIKEKLEQIKNGKLTAEENIGQILDTIKKKNKKLNVFLYVNEGAITDAKEIDKKIQQKKKIGRLAGLAIAVKANINVKGMPISCASKTLENYNGTYDAEVIEKIKNEDGIIIGIVNCDEFASGSGGEHSAFGATQNPAAPGRIPGGSSSGSAAAVAADMCDIALGSDTGGSVRNPASHCGIVGVKPSYGRVSRYGLIDLSMSLDQIGPLCKDVYGTALMLEIVSGKSDYDAITYQKPVIKYTEFKKPAKITIGVSKQFEKLCADKRISKLVEGCIEKIKKKLGATVKETDLKYIDLAIQTYYPIVYVEFFSGTRKFDGRRYGKIIEESCGEEVLRRILGGQEISKAEFAGKYYRKSLEMRELIKRDFKRAFEQVDVIISPVCPSLPHKIGEKITPEEEYAYDAFTVPANLAEICAGVIKAGEIDNIPVGLQVMAESFREDNVFNVMKIWEDILHEEG
ncbi:Asp-tRNA(Asn)/Glu-tRNA(Gln) amidotransferase subunit GatA [Candidatus Woesearchaeota archaeon]|nr:Asp-tRNA(Asn)/Glu-tRNA(Gln) amidotransferase subunit GatA [Candidatus Woesearchaeota archaeon]MBW3018138.1 Asp-tRNA(Asn)/Glu-tRNA(Gln) amidotransferase subunit GatA [Candidatus Woesearchaeota archaeon]